MPASDRNREFETTAREATAGGEAEAGRPAAPRFRLEEFVAQMRGAEPPDALDDAAVGQEFR